MPSSFAIFRMRGSGRDVIEAEQRARRVDLEQRAEQLLAVLIGPVDVLADEDHRLVALEPLLDAHQQLHQRLPARLGIDRGRRAPRRCAPSSMPKICSAVRASRDCSPRRGRSAAARAAGGARPRAARHPRRARARRARDRRSRRTASSRCRRAPVVRITTASPGAMPSRNVRTSVRLPTPASPTITICRLRCVTSTSRHASRSALSSRSRPCSALGRRGARAAAGRAPSGRAAGTRARA